MYSCAMCQYCFGCPHNDFEPVELDSQCCGDIELSPEFLEEGADPDVQA